MASIKIFSLAVKVSGALCWGAVQRSELMPWFATERRGG